MKKENLQNLSKLTSKGKISGQNDITESSAFSLTFLELTRVVVHTMCTLWYSRGARVFDQGVERRTQKG